MLDEQMTKTFQEAVWEYYHEHGRHDLPWRQPELDGSFSPYKITVSEIMLQQTQVGRVIPKYLEFLERFPSTESLAATELGDVLRAWNGLGYNRRAKFLHLSARSVVEGFDGTYPNSVEELVSLPGIGKNTAGAIIAYAYNQAVVFIETNVRTVFIHHFFADADDIHDKDILPLIEQTLPTQEGNYREWYWSLMDYGAYLKQTVGNLNRRSKSYARQSTFHGSRRQLRGQVLRILGERPHSFEQLAASIPDERLIGVVDDLLLEQMVKKQGDVLTI